MKNIFLSLLTVLAINTNAQSSIQLSNYTNTANVTPIAANEVIYLVANFGSTKKITFDIKNTSNTGKTYNAKRYDMLLNSTPTDTAVAFFCFGGLCYDNKTYVSPNPITLSAGKSASDTTADFYMLIAYLDDASKKGCSEVKYTFFDVNNTSDSIQVTLKYNCTVPVGVTQNKREGTSIEIYPQPVKNTATIRIYSDDRTESSLQLFNALGKLVLEKEIILEKGRNTVNFDVEGQSSGIYFIKLQTGEKSVTKKMIIN